MLENGRTFHREKSIKRVIQEKVGKLNSFERQ